MKRTPLTRKTPLRAKSGLKRKTRLRSMSPKRRRDQRIRSEMVRVELARRELCEAGVIIYQGGHQSGCVGLAVDLHEPLTRARGGSLLDADNTVAVCRSCHTWIHDNPAAAKAVGLLRSS